MIRKICVSLVALSCAAPALAAEGGPIRGGEHEGFSRVVLLVEPRTEWSLETIDGRATLFFPGKTLDFSTREVFERLPRTRIRDVDTETGPEGTTVSVELGCDCRVSTVFVSGQYLAVDVSDRDAPLAVLSEAEPDADAEDPEARRRREAGIVSSAEDVLIQQIERAANQGLIGLSSGRDSEDANGMLRLPGDLGSLAETTPPQPPARPQPIASAELPEPEDALSDAPAPTDVFDHDQITAMTVFDRDGGRVAAELARQIAPPECLPDDRLEIAAWSNGGSFAEQSGQLRRQLIGEFDAVDPDALVALVRLNIHFGMGAEAEALMQSFGYQGVQRALLTDMARVVDSRPASPYGPLARNAACPGAHGLWLATSGAAPVFHSAEHFLTVHAAFAALPRHLRALIGPTLIIGLVEDGRISEARLIYDTAVRPGHLLSAEMGLAEARLVAAEGSPRAAIASLDALIEADAHNRLEVLMTLVSMALDKTLAIPDRTVTDLRGALTLHRDTPLEPRLRELLARALGARDELRDSVQEIRDAKAKFPENPVFEAAAVEILAAADPARTGAAIYADVMLSGSDLIPDKPDYDTARTDIAAHLLKIGLPQLAADIAGPAAARIDSATLQVAEANLRLGRTNLVRLGLGGMTEPSAVALLARASAIDGDFATARSTLEAAGLPRAAQDYAWPAGDWPDVAGAEATDPDRVAMADYMASLGDPGSARLPAVAPEALSPPQAFVEPLPRLDRPSLDAARRLLATSAQLEDFVGGLLETGNEDAR